jgi:hypothetical protein
MFKLDGFTEPGAEPKDEAGTEETAHSEAVPALNFHAHDGMRLFSRTIIYEQSPSADAVGSVTFHPLQQLLLSVSGSRHFDDVDSDSDQESSSSGSSALGEEAPRGDRRGIIRRLRHRPQPSFRDNLFKLWHAGQEST